MGFFPWPKKKPADEQEKIAHSIRAIRGGSAAEREKLLESYIPFVLKVAAGVCGRYISRDNDEEFSIGLLALNEAVDAYDLTGGAPFLSFAKIVIRRRLVDYLRQQNKYRREVSLDWHTGTEDGPATGETAIITRKAWEEYAAEDRSFLLREEINAYRELLNGYGISFADLTVVSPRHSDARQRAGEVARLIAADPEMSHHLMTKMELPLKKLAAVAAVSRKTLERQRKYIIALTLLLKADFTYLQEYLAEGKNE
ncbi:MAG: RNA polymerase sigma-I factor [bacterium]